MTTESIAGGVDSGEASGFGNEASVSETMEIPTIKRLM